MKSPKIQLQTLVTLALMLSMSYVLSAQSKNASQKVDKKAEELFRKALSHDLVANGKRNTKQAIKYYSEAAKRGHSTAEATMAYIYAYGGPWHSGVQPTDPAKAFELARKSADANDGLGMAVLSVLYSEGIGTTADPVKGERLLMSAEKPLAKLAKENVPAAMEFLAELYYRKKRYKDALLLTKGAHVRGYVVASYAMGNFSMQYNVRRDARKYFEDAARFDHPAAIYKLAKMDLAENGSGKSETIKSYFQQVRKSAELRYPPAMRTLGKLYLEGKGTDKSVSTGLEWLKKAAKLNDGEAMIDLGIIHKLGLHGLPVEKKKAISQFHQAAQRGNANAAFFLSFEYLESGKHRLAIHWLKIAAQLGHPKAREMVKKSGNNLSGKKIFVPRLSRLSNSGKDWLKDPYYAVPGAYQNLGRAFGKTGPQMRMWEEDIRNRSRKK